MNGTNVLIDKEDYSLALDGAVAQPITTPAGWTFNENVATYNTASTIAGYKLVNNEIIYTPSVTSAPLFTVNGVTSTDGLYFEEKDSVVTVYNSALNKQEVAISGDYTLALAAEVATPTPEPNWTLDGTKATYQEGAIAAGYRLDGNKIVYDNEIDGTIKAELDGIASAPTVEYVEEKGTVKLTESNLEEDASIVSNAGEFEFEIAEGRYSEITFGGGSTKDVITNNGENIIFDLDAGSDKLTNNASNVTINAGNGNDRIINSGGNVEINGGAGNDNVRLGGEGGNLFIYNSGDGKDNVVGFKSVDTIKINGDAKIETKVKGNDVVIEVDDGSITLKDVAMTNAAITLVDSDNKPLISGNKYSTNGVVSGDTIILSSTFTSKYTADEVEIVDASQNTTGVSIDGGKEGISLIGGAGKDTIISGETDDFELTGGKGNDIFVYKGGKGSIVDYSQKGSNGKDKISIADSLTFNNYTINGDNIVLNYGDGNELTIKDGADKEITFGAKTSTIQVYRSVGIFDGKGKSVTLASGQENFTATKTYSKVETIIGSLVGNANITGNKKANYIVAGKDDSTLNGGKGKDTLVGGEGNDIFVYEAKSGNKRIQNFDSEQDKISLTGGASLSEVKVRKNDLELKVGSNKITIEGGAGKKFTFDDGEEKTFTANGLLVSGNSASLTSSFNGEATDLADYQNISAELIKKAIALTGFGDTNSLIGGKGNDTLTAGSGGSNLWGGKGNDLLYGGVGNDTFIFRAGDGTDNIFNYSEGDMLTILDKRGVKKSDYSKAVFSGDTLTLSIKGGGKIVLNGVNAGDGITINGTTKYITGKTLK